MSERKTILVAVDFQEASLDALSMAQDLAKRLDLEVTVLHIYTIPIVVYPGFAPVVVPGLPDEVAAAAKQAMDNLATSRNGIRPLVRAGDPATEILKATEELEPAMVVLGTHGRKGLSHLFLGSVAEKVVRSCAAPVLTVHARPR